ELGAFKPYGVRRTIDGVVREQEASLVALANAPSFGGGMRIAPDAQMDDGWMDVVIGHAMGRAQLMRLFPRLYRGTHVRSARVEVLRAREVVLEPLLGLRRPPPVYAVGELLGRIPLQALLPSSCCRRIRPHSLYGGMTFTAD